MIFGNAQITLKQLNLSLLKIETTEIMIPFEFADFSKYAHTAISKPDLSEFIILGDNHIHIASSSSSLVKV